MSNTEGKYPTQLDSREAQLFERQSAATVAPRSVQQEVLAQSGHVEELHLAIKSANRVSSPEQRLELLLRLALRTTSAAHRGAIYLRASPRHVFVLGAAFPRESMLVGSRISARGGYIDGVAQLQSPVLLSDIQGDGLCAYASQPMLLRPAQSALAVPFLIGGRTAGVLALENCERLDAFSEDDLTAVSLLGDYAAMVVENARLTMLDNAPLSAPGSWRRLAEHLPVGILVFGPHQDDLWANPFFCSHTGYTSEQLVQSGTRALFAKETDPSAVDIGLTTDLELIRRDQTVWRTKALFLDLRTIGGPSQDGRVGIFQDLRDSELLSKERFRMARLSTFAELVSGIAHELNDPLTAVLGFSELLLARDDLRPDCRKDLEAVVRHAQRSGTIVQDLLDLTHLEDEQLLEIDVNRMVRKAIQFRLRSSGAKDLDVVLDLSESIPPVVGDILQLQEVLLVLIGTAQEVSPSPQEAQRLWVRSCLHPNGNMVRVCISDTEAGLQRELSTRDPRPPCGTEAAGEQIKTKLIISQQIVAQQGGHLGFGLQPGKGSTFVVDLPTRGSPGCAE